MKYLLIAVIVPLSFLELIAQNSTTLDDIYGSESAKQVKDQYAEQLEFIEFYNENGYYLAEVPASKDLQEVKDIGEVEKLHDGLPDITSRMVESKILNVLGYNFRLNENKVQYYRLDENYLLVLRDVESVRKNLQEIAD